MPDRPTATSGERGAATGHGVPIQYALPAESPRRTPVVLGVPATGGEPVHPGAAGVVLHGVLLSLNARQCDVVRSGEESVAWRRGSLWAVRTLSRGGLWSSQFFIAESQSYILNT